MSFGARGSNKSTFVLRCTLRGSGLAPNLQTQRMLLNVYSQKWGWGLGVAINLRLIWDVPFGASGLAPNQQKQRMTSNVDSQKSVSGLGAATYLHLFWEVHFRAPGLPQINKCNVWFRTYIVKNQFWGSGQQHIYVCFEMYFSGLQACPKSTNATYDFEHI